MTQTSRSIALSLLGLILSSCASSPEQVAAQAQLEAEIAAKQGEAVNRICPRGSDGWKSLDQKRMLLEASGDWYMLELLGTCDPDAAFSGIMTRSSSATSCVERGDDVFTGRLRDRERCVITSIYLWDDDAEAPALEDKASD